MAASVTVLLPALGVLDGGRDEDLVTVLHTSHLQSVTGVSFLTMPGSLSSDCQYLVPGARSAVWQSQTQFDILHAVQSGGLCTL